MIVTLVLVAVAPHTLTHPVPLTIGHWVGGVRQLVGTDVLKLS